MAEIAKAIIALGVVLIIIGCVLWFGKDIGLGKLPGDIVIKRENFSFYFPLVTCIIISLVLSLIFQLWSSK